LVTQQSWLNQLYDNLQASGILAWIIIVGVVSLIFSLAGFSKNRQLVVVYSVYLLVVAIVAFLLAYWFPTNRILSDTVPFAIPFTAYGLLKARTR
jgi:hypothetical protein